MNWNFNHQYLKTYLKYTITKPAACSVHGHQYQDYVGIKNKSRQKAETGKAQWEADG